MTRRKNSADTALDDLGLFMGGKRAFQAEQPFNEKEPPMWQLGYRTAIRDRVREVGPKSINLRQRLLIERVRPKFSKIGRVA